MRLVIKAPDKNAYDQIISKVNQWVVLKNEKRLSIAIECPDCFSFSDGILAEIRSLGATIHSDVQYDMD